MQYRTLGRTGLKVSAIGIGTWQLSGPLIIGGQPDGFDDPGQDKVIDLIRACGELGINFIDSAEIYGDGEGERRVGEAIKGNRDQWILSTKFGWRLGKDGNRITNPSPDTIGKSLEGSLKRLQTDYVDIYLYHCHPDPNRILEGREVLETLKQEGKIRFYGISTYDHKVLGQLAAQNAAEVILFEQSLLTHPSQMLNLVKEHNLGAIVRGAFKSGLLSGKYFYQKPQFSDQDFRKHKFPLWDPQKCAVYEQFLSEGVPMTAFALRYLLDFDTTHTIVLGSRSIQNYRDALRVFELSPLDQKTHEALRRVRQQLFLGSLRRKIQHRVNGYLKGYVRMSVKIR
ncbi:MAG: aldo/keto reductase [Symploca sp. SIO2E9]|nr:aldo/keto reductase [Symploca sp. SIO2E9]